MQQNSLDQFAKKQFGLVTRWQAASIGITTNRWYRMNRDGRLLPIHTNVSVLFGYPETYEQRIMAGVLAIDGLGIASHRSALMLWGVWTPRTGEPVDIIKTARRGKVDLGGVIVHSPRDHESLAPIRLNGIRTTNPTRSLIDFGAIHPYLVPRIAEQMLMKGLIDFKKLKRAVAQHSARGRAGVGPARALTNDWPYSRGPADSVLELEFQRLLHGTEIPPYEFQYKVGPFIADFAWPEFKVIVETDGWGKFETKDDLERFAERHAYLERNGWIVLHFTWKQVTRAKGKVYSTLYSTLQSRGAFV